MPENYKSTPNKLIDLEAHFFTEATVNYLKSRTLFPRLVPVDSAGSFNLEFNQTSTLPHPKNLMAQLLDIGDGRIAEMDRNHVDVQVLSLTVPSGIECADYADAAVLAKDSNDELYEAILRHPDRLRGFAAISPHNVDVAVKELERAITKLNFVGWLTHSNFGGSDYLDNKQYWPLLEAAESLNVPIYLHPTVSNVAAVNDYGFATSGPAFGFQFDTALCLMRMIMAGVFDQFPKLKIMLGHLGETLIYIFERLDFMYDKPALKAYRPNIKRIPSTVLKENVYVTTSGRFHHPALNYIVQTLGEDKLFFASDYPMESLQKTVEFICDYTVSVELFDKVTHKNTEKLGIV